jgi:hypothetical protein
MNLPEIEVGCSTCGFSDPELPSLDEFEKIFDAAGLRAPQVDDLVRWYDRDGERISWGKGSWLCLHKSYVIVRHTHLPNDVVVSTVWLGMDHGYRPGTMLIFETMISGDYDYMERYATEDEAIEGHVRAEAWLMDQLAKERK